MSYVADRRCPGHPFLNNFMNCGTLIFAKEAASFKRYPLGEMLVHKLKDRL